MTVKITGALLAAFMVTSFCSLFAQDRHPHGERAATPDTIQEMQHQERAQMLPGPLGIPMTREGSGTSWLPDATPMYAVHGMAGPWELMLMGNAFLQYIDEGSDRNMGPLGSLSQFGSVNWFMGMAHRLLGQGHLRLRAMMSVEPITVGKCGYPDLLATGEFCRGAPLHDRQHPHDLFMDLSVDYQREIGRNLAFELYGAPVGEPALGPVAYPHRTSSIPNLIAPISHHWQDPTHISFGVVTAGLFGRRWKAEASAFNAREPDDDRFDLDLDALDSFAGRLSFLPNEYWSLQVSVGRLNEAEPSTEGGEATDIVRPTASAIYQRPMGTRGIWASSLVWGMNAEDGTEATHAVLLESNLNFDERNIFFGRAEVVGKTGHDLVLDDPLLEEQVFTVGKLQLGYVRQFGPFESLLPGIGASLSLSFVGDELEPFYGETVPLGFAVFGSLRPGPMMTARAAAAMARRQSTEAPMPHGEIPAPERPTEMPHETMPPAPDHGDLLSLTEVEAVLRQALTGFRLIAVATVRHPFWSVPTAVYRVDGAATPGAALQVTVYATPSAAHADADKIGQSGAVGTTMPRWVASPHFFLARNVLIALLVDAARDPGILAATERAVARLGGQTVETRDR